MQEAVPQMITTRGWETSPSLTGEGFDNKDTELLSTVCHELRTPLAIIRGYTSLLLDYDDTMQRPERQEYVTSIDKAASRLVDLVEYMLDMSRLELGQLRLDRAPVSISSIIREAAAEARLRAPGHAIRVDIESDLPYPCIDTCRIRQVLDNLLDNAIKYSPEGTQIVVSAVRQGTEILVSVSDRGKGIPSTELERVFQRLYRVKCEQTQDSKGVGLGLAICRGLVEAHGGRIWIASDEGRGSTVFFTLPILD